MWTFRSSTQNASVIGNGQIVEQQTFHHRLPVRDRPAADGLTLDERGLLTERLEDPRECVGSALLTLSDDALYRWPSHGGSDMLPSAPNSALLLEFETPVGAVISAIRRAALGDFVRDASAAQRRHAARPEGLGLADVYDWLLPITAYTDRHVEQMYEIAKGP